MGSVEGVAKPDDHATGAVQRTTDPDARISDAVVRSMGAVQRTTDPDARISDAVQRTMGSVQGTTDPDDRSTHADGLTTDPEGRAMDFIAKNRSRKRMCWRRDGRARRQCPRFAPTPVSQRDSA
jgi:hypothetical protein